MRQSQSQEVQVTVLMSSEFPPQNAFLKRKLVQSSTCKTDDHRVALVGRGVGRRTRRTGEFQSPKDAEGQVKRQIGL